MTAVTQKPEPLARVRARKLRQQAQARRVCTDAVWARAGGDGQTWGHCERCGQVVWRASTAPQMLGHVHEIVFRSRGGDPTDPANAELLCVADHARAHRLKVSA